MIGRYTTRAGIMSIDRQYLTVIETNWRQEKIVCGKARFIMLLVSSGHDDESHCGRLHDP